jgi:hypothetical protein
MAVGPTKPPIQWVPGTLSPDLMRPRHEADHSPPTSAEAKKNLDLYIHSAIRLHGIVLNLLSTRINLLFTYYKNLINIYITGD